MRATPVKLWKLPLKKAIAWKWKLGREKYGGTEFVGDPLVELYYEQLDSLNYLKVLKDKGIDLWMGKQDIIILIEEITRILNARDL